MTDQNNWKHNAYNRKFIASFSGGKDSVLALYKAKLAGEAVGLIVMLEEEGKCSRSHGMPPELIQAQAKSIGLPVYTASSSWSDYEQTFIGLLEKAKLAGAEVLVTGDLDMPEHGCWHEEVTKKAGLQLCMPLWEENHHEVVEEFMSLGFTTMIVTVNLTLGMRIDDLGKVLTPDYIKELEARGIDPCGEGGEFHTTVIDGPLFTSPIHVQSLDIIQDGDYAFLPLVLEDDSKQK